MADESKPNESWLKWLALSTTLFAVAAAICTIKSGGYSNRIAIMTTQENDKWAYFQAKSIKEHMYHMQEDTFQLQQSGPVGPRERKFIADKLKEYDAQITKYDKEKGDTQKEAEQLAADRDAIKEHSGRLGLAVMFLQIAIMLSSIASLLKQKPLWQTGLAMGTTGVVMLVYGLFF